MGYIMMLYNDENDDYDDMLWLAPPESLKTLFVVRLLISIFLLVCIVGHVGADRSLTYCLSE